mgnify:CR=1 FL=1
MIYIHRKPYGRAKRMVTTVYFDEVKAKEDHKLLGGELIECERVDEALIAKREHIKEVIVDELAAIIDDMSTAAPGSPRELEPGSSEWDLYKLGALNRVRELLNEI